MSDGQPAPTDLSTREREVADAYAAGQSYKEIARELGLSPTTVRSHLRTVYGKLGVTSKIELARFLTDETAPDATRDTGELAAEMALELDEAMRRERSLAKVLRIISDQDGELDAVIDAVLEHALEICEAEYGHLFEYHGDFMFSEMRSRGISPAFAAWLSEMGIFRVEPTTGVGRAAAELKPVSITDIRAGGLYETGSPLRVASVDFGKARSLAAIPMMSGNRLIGVFSVYRTRVHPFNERALELVQLFADQAAIAIENVRRFRQLQARAERDAATREILQVLSESRDDESPVFDAILENACKLCDAPLAYLSMVTEDRTHVVSPARRGAFESFGETLDRLRVPLDTSPLALARAIAECRVFREDDISDSDVYRNGDPNRVSMVEDEGARSRRDVAPFSDEDVALVEGFAAQAVIAIENVQQFRALERLNAELGDRVDEQVTEIERMARLKRFLSPAVADGKKTERGACRPEVFCAVTRARVLGCLFDGVKWIRVQAPLPPGQPGSRQAPATHLRDLDFGPADLNFDSSKRARLGLQQVLSLHLASAAQAS
jgi:GAF domain-containing protein/DNA-binding CsgD family transcriptional regulator